jgi:hypothetical protein
MAGICRSIYNFKPSVSLTALFYKSSVLKHKAGVQLTSGHLLVSFHSLRKTKTAVFPNIPLRPFQENATSEVDITSFYSFHTNK